MSKSVEVHFSSKKLEWLSGFSAPDDWDKLSSKQQYELIEQWKQEEIDRFVDVRIEVKDD